MARSFNPWRFDTIAIPPDLRREIIATELPVIPSERLYGHRASDGTSQGARPRLRVATVVALVVACFALAGWWVSS